MRELVLRVQRHNQERIEVLAPGLVKIGSLANADLRLDRGAPVIAIIDADEDGALLVRVDEDSAVTVNGAPLHGKIRLHTGDSVVVEDTTLTVMQLPSGKERGRSTAPTTASHSPRAVGLILVGIIGLGGAFLAPAIWADVRAANIRSLGAVHTGTVVALEDTGSRFNNDPVVWVTLEVDLGDRKVRGRVKDAISPVHLPRFQPGRSVQVWIDPKNPTEMALEEGL
jgi:hypothetical protein